MISSMSFHLVLLTFKPPAQCNSPCLALGNACFSAADFPVLLSQTACFPWRKASWKHFEALPRRPQADLAVAQTPREHRRPDEKRAPVADKASAFRFEAALSMALQKRHGVGAK